MIAVATAMMMGISLVTIGGHLIGVAGRMTQGNFGDARFGRCNDDIRPLHHMRGCRRPQREDKQTSKNVKQASHGIALTSLYVRFKSCKPGQGDDVTKKDLE